MIPSTSDIYVDITLQEDDLEDGTAGALIDYTALAGCMILVFQNVRNPLIEYQKNVPGSNPTGIKAIGVTDGPNGEIFILIPRAKTKVISSGDLYLQVFDLVPDSNGESNVFRAISDPLKIDTIAESVGKAKNVLV